MSEETEFVRYHLRMTRTDHKLISAGAKLDKRSMNTFIMLAVLDKLEKLEIIARD